MVKLIRCKACKAKISSEAETCPKCGHKNTYAADEAEKAAKLEKNKQINKKIFKLGCLPIIGLFAAFSIVAFFAEPTPEQIAERERTAEQKRLKESIEARTRKIEEANDRKYGFHCLSAWDGSLASFKGFIKENLNNPKSFEHVETKMSPVNDEGFNLLIMTFRGENAFGGTVTQKASAMVNNTTCEYTFLVVE